MYFFAVDQKQSDPRLAGCLAESGPNLRIVRDIDSRTALGALIAAVDSPNHQYLSLHSRVLK